MEIGITFPQGDFGADTGFVRDFAQATEDLGFSYVLALDHVLGAEHVAREPALVGPYDETTPFREPFSLFSFMSGCTRQLGFATGVLVLPQRQTALVAKQAAEVSMYSNGRFRLGVGVGWNYVEYEALGQEFRDRGRRQEEQVEVLRELWSQPLVSFEGTWHRLRRVAISPRSPHHIPVWFGGFSRVARERAARMGDGFMFSRGSPDQPEGRTASDVTAELLASAEELRGLVRDSGRMPDSFGLEGRSHVQDGLDQVCRDRDQFRDSDFSHLSVITSGVSASGPGAHIDALSEIAEALALTRPSP